MFYVFLCRGLPFSLVSMCWTGPFHSASCAHVDPLLFQFQWPGQERASFGESWLSTVSSWSSETLWWIGLWYMWIIIITMIVIMNYYELLWIIIVILFLCRQNAFCHSSCWCEFAQKACLTLLIYTNPISVSSRPCNVNGVTHLRFGVIVSRFFPGWAVWTVKHLQTSENSSAEAP